MPVNKCKVKDMNTGSHQVSGTTKTCREKSCEIRGFLSTELLNSWHHNKPREVRGEYEKASTHSASYQSSITVPLTVLLFRQTT